MVKLNDNCLMPFGAYKGQKLANVPASYLLWAYDNLNLQHNLKAYIDENRAALEQEKKQAARDQRL